MFQKGSLFQFNWCRCPSHYPQSFGIATVIIDQCDRNYDKKNLPVIVKVHPDEHKSVSMHAADCILTNHNCK